MTEFREQDLSGAIFERVSLRDARLRRVDLTGAEVRGAKLHHVTLHGVELFDVDITGDLDTVIVNGVDIAPLVEAELNRRDPERVKMKPDDVDGFKEAWAILQRLWAGTIETARSVPAAALHTGVGGEWSFIQTLRHLNFASAAWVGRMILGDPSPWHPLDLPWDEAPGWEGIPWDREARPTLERGARRSTRAAGDGRRCHRVADRRAARVAGVTHRTGMATDRAVPGQGVPADRAQRGMGAPPVRRARPRRAPSNPVTIRRVSQWEMVDEGWGRRAVDFAALCEPHSCREYVAVHHRLGITGGQHLLDVACGSGLAIELARIQGAICAGIDASQRLVAVARDRNPDSDIRIGDMEALPWDDETFDIVTSFRGIWGTTPTAVDEVHRVLVPGGRFAMTVWGDVKKSTGGWMFVPFRWATESKVRHQADMVALGRPGIGEAFLAERGFDVAERFEVPFVIEFPDPNAYRAVWRRPGRRSRRSRKWVRRSSWQE